MLFDPPGFTPVLDQDGRYRVTFGPGSDVVRGFTPDGRLMFRAYDLVPFGRAWILASVPLDGGDVREEVAVYRPALLYDVGSLSSDSTQRVLGLWQAAVPGLHGCPDSSIATEGTPAPRTPSPVGIILYALSATDGVPIASLPSRYVPMTTVSGAGTIQQRVRVNPAVRDADRAGANPFGPVLLEGSDELIYSDGEQLWQASVTDTSQTPIPIGFGAYPALSRDRRTLAYARPLGLDSTVGTFVIPLGIVACVEEHVEVTAASWEVVVRDLETSAEVILTTGFDPAFDPQSPRLVVRGPDLRWVDLANGAVTPIPATVGAFAPAVSADGGILAFSLLNPATSGDVYFLRIAR